MRGIEPTHTSSESPAALTRPLSRLSQQVVRLRGAEGAASLIATVAYLATLIGVRLLTTLTKASPTADVDLWGTHIHHFVFGIVAILGAGVLALDDLWPMARAVVFGVGAALVLDEFALAVYLRDVYWLPQGSRSLFALVVGLVALVVNSWRFRRTSLKSRSGGPSRTE